MNPIQSHFDNQLEQELQTTGDSWQDAFPDAIGRTLFDLPGSQDHTVTVVLPPEHITLIPSRAWVRIREQTPHGQGRQYIGMVVQGPFVEPDGLRADAPIVVTVAVQGALFLPRYHGRVQVSIIGEELADGVVIPARFRPLPNSPVFLLSATETAAKLKIQGDIRLGQAVGYTDMPVCLSSDRKDVFPRHTAILGSTGAGKSTTVSRVVGELSGSGAAVILFDTEGEYTHLMHPTDDPRMQQALAAQGLEPVGLDHVTIYHLVGRDTTHPDAPQLQAFGLEFSRLSPYAVMEILGLNEAQQERYLRAYELAKHLLTRLKIYPATPAEAMAWLERDELETGYPRLTLQMMYDLVWACAERAADLNIHPFTTPLFEQRREEVLDILHQQAGSLPGNTWSWRKVQGALGRVVRLRIFDVDAGLLPDYTAMTQPGQVTIVDLSGTGSRPLNNLVISQLLLGIWEQQEVAYLRRTADEPPQKTVIVIEEAHEFLSSARIKQMEVLFDQLTRIARRGRKRWLGLVFVSQSPEDLPDELLGLVNNFILHKISNSHVISRLKRTVGGMDEGLWERLSDLEPGLAVVKAGNLSRPLLVAIDPTPYKLLMID